VGKVQGNRRRKHPQPFTSLPVADNGARRNTVPPVTPPPSQATFLDTEHDDLLSWGNDLQLGSSHPEYLNDSGISSMDFSLNDLLQSPSVIEEPVSSSSSTRQPMPLSLGLRPRNEQDSQCILECVRIITDVENYIMAELKSFKILLSIIREALNSLKRLIGLQQASRNLRCLFLFSTIQYQVLEMLEACFTNVQRECNIGGNSTAGGLGTWAAEALHGTRGLWCRPGRTIRMAATDDPQGGESRDRDTEEDEVFGRGGTRRQRITGG